MFTTAMSYWVRACLGGKEEWRNNGGDKKGQHGRRVVKHESVVVYMFWRLIGSEGECREHVHPLAFLPSSSRPPPAPHCVRGATLNERL